MADSSYTHTNKQVDERRISKLSSPSPPSVQLHVRVRASAYLLQLMRLLCLLVEMNEIPGQMSTPPLVLGPAIKRPHWQQSAKQPVTNVVSCVSDGKGRSDLGCWGG